MSDNEQGNKDDYAELDWTLAIEARVDRATRMGYVGIVAGIGGMAIGVFAIKAIGKLGMALSNVANVVQQMGGQQQPIVATSAMPTPGPMEPSPRESNGQQPTEAEVASMGEPIVGPPVVKQQFIANKIAEPIDGPASEPSEEQKALMAAEGNLADLWNAGEDAGP